MKPLFFILALLSAALPARGGAEMPKKVLPHELTTALQTASKVTLFSLDPSVLIINRNDPRPRLGNWLILGQTNLAKPQRSIAVKALIDAIKSFDGQSAMCFDPRHALRVTTPGHTYDFIICFACRQVWVWEGSQMIATAGITGPKKPFDDILTAAKVPLPRTLL